MYLQYNLCLIRFVKQLFIGIKYRSIEAQSNFVIKIFPNKNQFLNLAVTYLDREDDQDVTERIEQ